MTKNLVVIIKKYKLFSLSFIGMLCLLLVRIPLGTFNNASLLDTFAHFALPATGAPLLAALILSGGKVPKLNPGQFVIFALLLGVLLEVGWEIIEFIVDILFELGWQVGNTDTMIDIILGIAGGLIGSILFVMVYRKQKIHNLILH